MGESTPIRSKDVYATSSAPWTRSREPSAFMSLPHVKAITDLPDAARAEAFRRLLEIHGYGLDITPETVQQIAETAQSQYAERQAEWERKRRYRPARETDTSVVYYLSFADRVKIGTTTDLAKRLACIPHDEVLATEVGGYALERKRHRQFAAAQINGEWFTRTPELEAHIEGLTP